MSSKRIMRLLLIGTTVLALVLAIAPASFAGEDDGGDGDTTTTEQPAPAPAPEQSSSSNSSGGGSSDSQVAVGGVQTGFGGMASAGDANVMLPLSIGGGLVLLASAGAGTLAIRRR
jgi:uncharacterized membrane protein YphA (DoxX/SURF4 family)